MITIKHNAKSLAANIANTERGVGAGVERAMRNSAYDLRDNIVAHAHGRPGPNVNDGDYIASWRVRGHGANRAVTSWSVYTQEPYAHRLEEGFYGYDSLGRFYNQPPFPHVRPAIDELSPQIQLRVAEAVRKS